MLLCLMESLCFLRLFSICIYFFPLISSAFHCSIFQAINLYLGFNCLLFIASNVFFYFIYYILHLWLVLFNISYPFIQDLTEFFHYFLQPSEYLYDYYFKFFIRYIFYLCFLQFLLMRFFFLFFLLEHISLSTHFAWLHLFLWIRENGYFWIWRNVLVCSLTYMDCRRLLTFAG